MLFNFRKAHIMSRRKTIKISVWLRRFIKRTSLVQLMVIYILNLGCANIFSEMADKSTDKALLYETKLKLGKGEWDGALAQIALMSTDYQERRDVKVLKSSAYAGKCGLNFVDLAVALQSGSSALFSILLSARTGATTTNLDSCVAGENILVALGSAGTRTGEENLLLAFASLIKIANILNIRGDTDADATVDATWDPCDAANGAGTGETNLPTSVANRADSTEIVTGLALFLESIAAAGAGSSAGDFYSDLNDMCSALPVNPCSANTRASVTAEQQRAIRALITGNDDGIGMAINPTSAAVSYATICATN